jgi:integrase/recombinase XerD
MSADAWTEAFLEMMSAERGAAAHTLRAYANDLEDAGAFLRARGSDFKHAAPEDLEAYFRSLAQRGLAASTAARRRSALRQFYRFVLDEGWREGDPTPAGSNPPAAAGRCPRSSAGARWSA